MADEVVLVVESAIKITYTTSDDGRTRVDMKLKMPDDIAQVILLQPAIEMLMAVFATHDKDGFEFSLDKLRRGALRQAGKIKLEKEP